MKSDILRYEILYREGGIYIDIDYECLQSIENIINNCTFFAGLSSTSTLEISNGIIGSIPGHPLLQMLLSSIKTLQIENIEAVCTSNIYHLTTKTISTWRSEIKSKGGNVRTV
jgi:mannosyltransferase OCH1-like enzyme